MNFSYYMPTRIIFGAGSLEKLATADLPGSKALIVISAGTSMKRTGYLDRVVGLLAKNGVESVVFDRIQPNPLLKHVTEGAAVARDEACDMVVGLGGGSSIDSAKSIAFMVKNPGNYWDYISGGSGRGKAPEAGALPVIAITTTAGTGTEADPWTVITREESREKIGFGNDDTFPYLSIVDPELMVSVPRSLTTYQGFDALFHAVEGYIAGCANVISDLFALKSIELLAKWLPKAVADGSDIEARGYVALANTLSGFVESTSSCTSEHSMEHALSAYHPNLPHGAGLILLSVAYHRFFAERAVPERYTAMAEAMGTPAGKLAEGEKPLAFIAALKKLIRECGVESLAMSQFGITREEIPGMAKNARETMGVLFEVDPLSLTLEDTESIMADSFA